MELWVIFGQFLKNLLLYNHWSEIIHIWFGESPGGLVSSLFKLGCCDLYLRLKLTIFVKHIFDFFSQTTALILMKFGSYMHLSKLTQVCSNQGCMTYFHWVMLMSFRVVYNTYIVYLQCITICHYVISHFFISLGTAAWICFKFCVDVSLVDPY